MTKAAKKGQQEKKVQSLSAATEALIRAEREEQKIRQQLLARQQEALEKQPKHPYLGKRLRYTMDDGRIFEGYLMVVDGQGSSIITDAIERYSYVSPVDGEVYPEVVNERAMMDLGWSHVKKVELLREAPVQPAAPAGAVVVGSNATTDSKKGGGSAKHVDPTGEAKSSNAAPSGKGKKNGK